MLGGGTPYFASMEHRLDLRLIETRSFPGGVVVLRYDRAGSGGVMATKKSAKSTNRKSRGFTNEERAAMREHARELKAEARGTKGKPDEEGVLLAKIAEMPEPDRAMAKRIHAILKESAPVLSPTTWYGMPAWAKNGKVICFFQSAQKFKTRYSTFGFSDKANLDEGAMWPTAFALKDLTAADETKIAALVKKAAS